MKNYTEYEIEDFLIDESFLSWRAGSGENQQFWEQWPDRYPDKAYIYHQAVEIVSVLKIDPVRSLSDAEVQQMINAIAEKTFDAVPVRKLKWYNSGWMKIAAAVLLICSFGLWKYFDNDTSGLVEENVSATTLVKVQPGVIRLPENSTVVLKKGGRLSYSTDFNKDTREVYLEGEAFFEVTKNPSKPFIVHANDLVTKVLGTSFSVIAYKAAKEFKVVVNTGKVSVFPASSASKYSVSSKSRLEVPAKGVLIMPNQEVTFYRAKEKLSKKNLEKPTALSKVVTDIKFNFKDEPFSGVVAALQNAYGIKISYNKARLAGCPLTASLSDQHLYEKLDLICQAIEAEYKIVDGGIVIDGKGCENLNQEEYEHEITR